MEKIIDYTTRGTCARAIRITLEDKLGSAYEPYIFAALNSAKEVAVAAFLKEKIAFYQIEDIVHRAVAFVEKQAVTAQSLEDILACANQARAFAESIL